MTQPDFPQPVPDSPVPPSEPDFPVPPQEPTSPPIDPVPDPTNPAGV